MKKIFALLLTVCLIFTLTSCALIRKIEPEDTAKPENTEETEPAVETDFPETEEGADSSEDELRYTEDEAFALLSESFGTAEGEEQAIIEKTGDMTAQSNGTEYYIFKVTLPETAEDEAEDEAEGEEDTTEADSTSADSAEDEEEKPEGPVNYYVSTNGIVYTSLEEENSTVSNAADTYLLKHGETDEATGYAYKIEYKGLVKNQTIYCYSFIVYLENTSSGETQLEYKTHYLVSLDGKSSGEQVMENK